MISSSWRKSGFFNRYFGSESWLKLQRITDDAGFVGFLEHFLRFVLVVPASDEPVHSLAFKIGTPLRELERQAIKIALGHTRGNKPMAARLLGIASRTVYRHLGANEEDQKPE